MPFIFQSGKHPNRHIYLGHSYTDSTQTTLSKRVKIGTVDPILDIEIYDIDFFKAKEIEGVSIPEEIQNDALVKMLNTAKKVLSLPDEEKKQVAPATIFSLHELLALFEDKSLKEIQESILNETNKKILPKRQVIPFKKKSFGAFYLFDRVSKQIKLKKALKIAFPDDWKEIFMLSCYLVSTNQPLKYCQNWVNNVDGLPVTLTLPKINQLMMGLKEDQVNYFYTLWNDFINEKDLVAFDLLSISSPSCQFFNVDFSFNLGYTNINQINAWLLFGQSSLLPVYFKPYTDPFKDVSSLKDSLASIYSSNNRQIPVILDKKFARIRNINEMLDGPQKNDFLISLPFMFNDATQSALIFSKGIQQSPKSVLHTEANVLRTTINNVWENGCPVYFHTYFNHGIYNTDTARIQHEVQALQAKFTKGRLKYIGDKQLAKWAKTSYDQDKRKEYSLNQTKIDFYTSHIGWSILLSNFINDHNKALNFYIIKDLFENYFFKLKLQLDLKRPFNPRDKVTTSKLLLIFISFIILSALHKPVLEIDKYITYSVEKLIREMEYLSKIYTDKSTTLESITSNHKYIFNLYNLKEPNILI
ncbi:MAG: hypothetical protein LBF58_02575 [Deltaproteobacteria bacterium]|jgi:hypothetical protein|nr:hypothetical protein [Deltaproteobacteria bacterium]